MTKAEKHYERTIEQIALLLLSVKLDRFGEQVTMSLAADEAADMATRARNGWWVLPGRPAFNKRMASLRKKYNDQIRATKSA